MLYKLKSVARRGTLFGAAAALAAASFAPLAPPAYADSLNPLTDRSLTLSSSAPGWDHFDGSNNETYAQPNSGANGQKTGNTFDFKVSSTSDSTNPISAMSFQYCTTSAGECLSPGDNAVSGTDTDTTSDLKVNFPSPDELDSGDFSAVVGTDGVVDAIPGFTDPNDTNNTTGQFAASQMAGNYVVYYDDGGTWTQSTGWNMAASNVENYETDETAETGQENYISLWNDTGLEIPAGTQMKVVFFGTDDNYITNPGSGAFFVKINTYSDFTGGTAYTEGTPAVAPTLDTADIIDGGVTVANVMNHSIRIQTKVLETMKFSVGTVDPNTLESNGNDTTSEYGLATGQTEHGTCDPIVGSLTGSDSVNVLKLGNQASESALSDQDTYATHSFWRLSSNSSAGATVYYSGVTLSNTVGDKISAIGPTAAVSHEGDEQFGLALMNGNEDNNYAVDYSQPFPLFENTDYGTDITSVHQTTTDANSGNASWHTPQLYPLVPSADYAYGAGDTSDSGGGPANAAETTPGSFSGEDTTAKFAFDETSNSVPVALASNSQEVVDCVTAKVRYIANISSTTPAGIYTTAVNYIAAPQY